MGPRCRRDDGIGGGAGEKDWGKSSGRRRTGRDKREREEYDDWVQVMTWKKVSKRRLTFQLCVSTLLSVPI